MHFFHHRNPEKTPEKNDRFDPPLRPMGKKERPWSPRPLLVQGLLHHEHWADTCAGDGQRVSTTELDHLTDLGFRVYVCVCVSVCVCAFYLFFLGWGGLGFGFSVWCLGFGV